MEIISKEKYAILILIIPLLVGFFAAFPARAQFEEVGGGNFDAVSGDSFSPVSSGESLPVSGDFTPVSQSTFEPVSGNFTPVSQSTFEPVSNNFEPVSAMAFTPSQSSFSFGSPSFSEGSSNVGLNSQNFNQGNSNVNITPVVFNQGNNGVNNSPLAFNPGLNGVNNSPLAFTPGASAVSNNPLSFSQGFSSVFNTPNFFSQGFSSVPLAQAAGVPVALAAVPATGIMDDPRIIFFLVAILGLGALLAYSISKFLIKKNLFGLASDKIKLPADGLYVFAEAMKSHFELLSQVQWDDPIREKLIGEMDNLKAIIGSGAFKHVLFEKQAGILRALWGGIVSEGDSLRRLKESLFELELIIRGQKEKKSNQGIKTAVA